MNYVWTEYNKLTAAYFRYEGIEVKARTEPRGEGVVVLYDGIFKSREEFNAIMKKFNSETTPTDMQKIKLYLTRLDKICGDLIKDFYKNQGANSGQQNTGN